jgi:hypothetical protein
MQFLNLVDLTVYLMVGIVLVLYTDQMRQSRVPEEERKPRGIIKTCGVWLVALMAGLAALGCRHMVTRLGQSKAFATLAKDFEVAQPFAGLDPVANK